MLGAGMMGAGDRLRVRAKRASRSCSRTSRWRPPSAARPTRETLVDEGRRARALDQEKARRAAGADHADRRPAATGRRRPRDRGGVRGPGVKAEVFAEIEPYLAPDALLGSNTSTLPITELAEGVSAAGRLHRAALLLARWTRCRWWRSSRASRPTTRPLSRALDVAKQIKKTPIVVNDSRGLLHQPRDRHLHQRGRRDAAEGVPAASIEQASSQAGYPAPVLQLADELNLELSRRSATRPRRRSRPKAACSRTAPLRGRDRPHARARAARGRLARRRLLRVRGRQARRPVAGPAASVPGDRATRRRCPARPRGADAVRRGDRGGQVPRRGRDRVGRGRQHRLDLRDRLSRLDGRRAAVHQRLRVRHLAATGPPASSPVPASWPRSTASASSRPPRCSRRPSGASSTASRRPSPGHRPDQPGDLHRPHSTRPTEEQLMYGFTLTDEQQPSSRRFVISPSGNAASASSAMRSPTATTNPTTRDVQADRGARLAGGGDPDGVRRLRRGLVDQCIYFRRSTAGKCRSAASRSSHQCRPLQAFWFRRAEAGDPRRDRRWRLEAIAMSEPEAGSDVGNLVRGQAAQRRLRNQRPETWSSEAQHASTSCSCVAPSGSRDKHRG